MNSLRFHRLNQNDFAEYQEFYRLSGSLITDLTLSCRMAWDPVFRTEICFFEDSALMISDGGGFTDPHLLMPLGSLDSDKLNRILLMADDEFRARGWKLKVMCIEEDKVDLFSNLRDFSAELSYSDSASDYVYDANALRTLSGNVLHKKRNHVNRFLRLYPNYRYRSLTSDDVSACLSLVKVWCDAKGIDPEDAFESDYRMIENLFSHYDTLSMRGGLIEINGLIRAFSLGSAGNGNTAYMHFEKADPSFDGIYAAINRLTIENEFPDAAYINREEDMGIPGLRKSKESYDPILLRKKFRAWPVRRGE
jgi:uncharacterized protein